MKKHLFSLLALLLMAAGSAMAQTENTASVRQLTRNADGDWVLDQMPDFDGQLVVTFYEQFRLDSIPLAWTIMVNGADSSAGVTAYTEGDTTKGWLNILEGSFVELIPPTVVKPKVKNVTLTDNTAPTGPVWNTVDLSTLTGNYEAQDHDLLTGTLGQSVKITIADGATVTLDGVTIATADGNSYYEDEETSEDVDMYPWSGITCEGDATIILTGENTVKGFREYYPGIYVPSGKTLIITGTGSLTASSNGWGTGIGGGYDMACGNIEIKGGVITATGGRGSAGIGSGNMASCGTITISGGTVTATGGGQAAGIGSGCYNSNCGDITITTGVTKVTATKGTDASHSIGAGYLSSCSTVTIGGVVGAISTSPYTYQP